MRPRTAGTLLGFVHLVLLALTAAGGETLRVPFATNDVIAMVGGEDVVEFQRNGYLEVHLTCGLQSFRPRFRNLGVEGDTVFEQHRQLNFPSWEETLQKVGATIVFAQFGQTESLKGPAGAEAFVAAYQTLLSRFATRTPRLVLISPTRFEAVPGSGVDAESRNAGLAAYVAAIGEVAARKRFLLVDVFTPFRGSTATLTRDGVHLNAIGQWLVAAEIARQIGVPPQNSARVDASGTMAPPALETLRQAIVSKNRLWFDYWRPQNWAFLHGDRTEQASSRDHRNPKIRWFPTEMEQFLPLIAAKENEIAMLAAATRGNRY